MFGYSNYNMNMLGMSSMSFGNMGMFNMGGLNMFGNMFGSSIFTNCDGSFNYDTYAGFQVGNVLMNIGGAILGQVIQNKAANSNKTLTANIGDLNKRIADVETEKTGYDDNKKELETKVSDAKTELTSLNEQLSKLNVSDLKAKYERAYNEYTNAKTDDPELPSLETAMKEAKKAYEEELAKEAELEEKIAAQQKIINDNKPKIEELNGKIDSCDKELEALKAERDAIQKQLNEAALDKADGNKLNRTTAEDFAKLYDTENNKYKDGFDASNISKSDLRYIISQYRASDNAETKQKWANIMKTIYNDTNLDSSVKSDNIRAAYKLMCE